MTNYKGYVLQRGVSPIDGKPFVVIMTMQSKNRKTGNMIQVWIMRDDIDPVEAVREGDDFSICGKCPHRGFYDAEQDKHVERSCYVNVGQAPLQIWKTYKQKKYGQLSDLTPEMLQGRKIRWGSYGDPALVSPILFATINEHADAHTGYTHQWREPWAQWCKGLFQASCDGLDDYLNASAHGWQTFAVIPKGTVAYSGKICPTEIQGSQSTCETCRLCDGAKTDVYIEAHGRGAGYVAQN